MRKIIDTHHSIDQFHTRYEDRFSKERIKKVVNDGMYKIINQYNDVSTTYAIWSKSTGIAVIIDWRPDNKTPKDTTNHAIIITLPPIKKSIRDFKTTKPQDVKIIVESMLRNSIRFKEGFFNYLQEVKIGNLSLWFEDGKLYDSGISYFIDVE